MTRHKYDGIEGYHETKEENVYPAHCVSSICIRNEVGEDKQEVRIELNEDFVDEFLIVVRRKLVRSEPALVDHH